jgi:hypothetical protein
MFLPKWLKMQTTIVLSLIKSLIVLHLILANGPTRPVTQPNDANDTIDSIVPERILGQM